MSEESILSASSRNTRIFSVVRKSSNEPQKESTFNEGRWTNEEHKMFLAEVLQTGIKNWKKLESKIRTRTNCQIRSHFQKYLKKLCAKYNLSRNLNEIFLDGKKLESIDPVDRKFIKIFNVYKKGRILLRKRKMTLNYQKRLAKKKFFKVKKSESTNEFKEELPCAKQEPPQIYNEQPIIIKNNPNTQHEDLLLISHKLMEISNWNKFFIESTQKLQNYNFNSNLQMLRRHVDIVSKFLQK